MAGTCSRNRFEYLGRTGRICAKCCSNDEKSRFQGRSGFAKRKNTYKIRDHSVNKVPYLIVVGDKEKNANTVAVRARGGVDLGVMTVEELMARMENEIQSKQ